jgi:hypothetical protein
MRWGSPARRGAPHLFFESSRGPPAQDCRERLGCLDEVSVEPLRPVASRQPGRRPAAGSAPSHILSCCLA